MTATRRDCPLDRHDAGRSAYTLIELLAASVLTAILLAGVLLALRASLVETRTADLWDARLPGAQLLREQMRRDVGNATGAAMGAGSLTLFGPLATDAAGQPTLRPATVTYAIRPISGRGVLIREERGRRTRREAVWVGCSQLTAASMVVEAAPPRAADTGGLPPISDAVRMLLTGADGQTLIDETIGRDR